MKTLRNMSNYGWTHPWALMPTQMALLGIWLVGLPYWVWRRDRQAAMAEHVASPEPLDAARILQEEKRRLQLAKIAHDLEEPPQ